jgi:hypothetical protein
MRELRRAAPHGRDIAPAQGEAAMDHDRPANPCFRCVLLLAAASVVLISGRGSTAAAASAGAPDAPAGVHATLITEPTADAWVYEYQPTENYGSLQHFYLGRSGDIESRALLRFDLRSIPAGAKVTSAYLHLHKVTPSGAAAPDGVDDAYYIWVHRNLGGLMNLWTESTVTWNRRPLTAESDQGGFLAGGADGLKQWNVTNSVRKWVQDGEPNNGFTLKGDGVSAWSELVMYMAREGPVQFRPLLEVHYTLSLYLPLALKP